MSVLWKFSVVLLILALTQVQVEARPARPNTFISLPIQKVHLRDTTHEHPAIVTTKRYLTGRVN